MVKDLAAAVIEIKPVIHSVHPYDKIPTVQKLGSSSQPLRVRGLLGVDSVPAAWSGGSPGLRAAD